MSWQRYLVLSDVNPKPRFHLAFGLVALIAIGACGPSSAQIRTAERTRYVCSTAEIRASLTRHLVEEFDSIGEFGEWMVGPNAAGISWSGKHDIEATTNETTNATTSSSSSSTASSTRETAASSGLFLLPPRRGGPPNRPTSMDGQSNTPQGSGRSSLPRKRSSDQIVVAFARIVEHGIDRTIEIKGRVLEWSHGTRFTIDKSSHADDVRDRLVYAVYKDLKQCRR